MKKLLAITAILFAATSAVAVNIIPGKVYRVINNGNPALSMAINASGTMAVTLPTDATDIRQQWVAEPNSNATAFFLRNVVNGGYLTSSLATSTQWKISFVEKPEDSSMLMMIEDFDKGQRFKVWAHNSTYGYAHSDASNHVVCWTASGSANSIWNFVEVDYTDEQLSEIEERFKDTADQIANAAVYDEHLGRLFTDRACTKLIEGVALDGNPDFEALPATLKAMARKVRSGDWSENTPKAAVGDWNSDYAKKYRVQLYEPYSEGANGAALAGIQAYTNMNNPTGILADKDDLLYVMVEDAVPEGATLYIGAVPDENMYNSTTDGIPLHQGLNTILSNTDNTHYYIYYTVTTVDKVNNIYTPGRYKISSFSPIKIHIEGGRINGFFNYVGDALYTPDTRKDLEYTLPRATHKMYDLMGKYVILHLHLEDTPSQVGQDVLQKCVRSALLTNPTVGDNRTTDPVKILTAWDNMCFAERMLMGLATAEDVDNAYNKGYYESIVNDGHKVQAGDMVYDTDPGFFYTDYFNNRMMGISQQGTLFMNATSWRTAFNVSTIDAILTSFPGGDIWGPAHEYGHMNQGPMNMAGTTEVSNNIFSNVAMYYAGLYSSRCQFISDQNANFQAEKTFLDAGTWGTTRMFWQLWCYYHATGHNKKFYPRLYQLLRKYPLKKTTIGGGDHNERYDMLHFAEMACIAAEEDLTAFFEGWGFFVPLKDYKIDDYSQYNAQLTQEDIDEVKAEIASFNFRKNDVILLIDDRPGSNRTSYPGFPIASAGELGGLRDFDSETGAVPSGEFDFTMNSNIVYVTTTGNPGVGFLIYDEDGNLLGFANSDKFTVSDEVAKLLAEGKANVQAMAENGEATPVVNTMLDGTPAKKRGMLEEIVTTCNTLLDYVDPTKTRVGYILPEPAATLMSLRDEARELLDEQSEDGDALTDIIRQLHDEYNALSSRIDVKVKIDTGATYRISNKSLPARALAGKAATSTTSATAISVELTKEADPYYQQWRFEPLEKEGEYALKNVATGLYLDIQPGYKANTVLPLGEEPFNYTVNEMPFQTGVFYIAPENRQSSALHMNNSGLIYHYTTTSANSQWFITMVEDSDYIAARQQLEEVIETASELLDEVAYISVGEPEKVALTPSCLYANAVQKSGNGAFRSWNDLLDGNLSTYFASDRTGADSADGLDHYIRITAPDDETFRHFVFHYNANNFQTNAGLIYSYRIDASLNGIDWAPVFEKNEGIDNTYGVLNESDLITVPEGTKHIRFVVTRSGETKAMHYTFLISEIGVDNTAETTYIARQRSGQITEAIEAVDKALALARFKVMAPATPREELELTRTSLADAVATLADLAGIETGVEAIDSDSDSDSDIYYDLNGLRVANPGHGIYIYRNHKVIK